MLMLNVFFVQCHNKVFYADCHFTGTQHNDTWQNDPQLNDSKQNEIQHNGQNRFSYQNQFNSHADCSCAVCIYAESFTFTALNFPYTQVTCLS
jgi:hypothetical protein